MVRLHRGDHGIDRAALERVHGGGSGAVDMAELRVAGDEVERAPVLRAERNPAVLDRRDLGGAAVDEPEPGIVPGPADAVASPELDLVRDRAGRFRLAAWP